MTFEWNISASKAKALFRQRRSDVIGQKSSLHRFRGLGFAAAMLLILCLLPAPALSAGTSAGTTIFNSASVNYSIGLDTFVKTSPSTSIMVIEVLDASLTWQDAAPVSVGDSAADQVLTFRLTNIGNGTEQFRLTSQSNLTGDDFNPIPSGAGIYLDSNGNDIYDPGIDEPYSPGVNDPQLAADVFRTVFILSDIPVGLTAGATGDSRLEAIAVSGGSGTPGFLHPNAGDGNIDAVDGSSGGLTDALGTYVVSDVSVVLVKSAVVTDPDNGNQPITGATITYTILVTVSGVGSAENIVISDPIPVNTSYTPATLRLDTVALTDEADGDAGDVSVTAPGTVTVNLGDMAGGSPTRSIEFSVLID